MKSAVELICEFEGFRPQAYVCLAGKWTIGFGRTEGVTEGDTTTIDNEHKYVLRMVEGLRQSITLLLKVPVTTNQMEALISFVYNIGLGAFKQSTLLKFLNQGKVELASEQFSRWNRGGGKVLPGLIRRREAEREVFDA